MTRTIPGVHIQWPWSQLILSGKKTVETRGYRLPPKFEGVELAIIETPGPRGKSQAGITKARIVGTVTFSASFQYKTKRQWLIDVTKHCVQVDDPLYAWGTSKERWGWLISSVKPIGKPIAPPSKRGIVFATSCEIF